MNPKFDSTSMILETVWFAKEAIDYANENIDWPLIERNEKSIRPSSTELLRLDIAKQFWSGYGKLLDYFNPLDTENRRILFEALSIKLSML